MAEDFMFFLFIFIIVTIITLLTFSSFDLGGFGTEVLAISYSLLYAVNGVILIFIGLFTKKQSNIFPYSAEFFI